MKSEKRAAEKKTVSRTPRKTAAKVADKAPRKAVKKRLSGDVAKAVRAALDKKAVDVVVLDLRSTPAFTDYFVLCSGINQRQVKAIADAVPVPVIASGGVGKLDDLVDGVRSGHASAVAAASLFHFTDQSVIKARSYMRQAGLDMRVA